jgi:hypothetical protein
VKGVSVATVTGVGPAVGVGAGVEVFGGKVGELAGAGVTVEAQAARIIELRSVARKGTVRRGIILCLVLTRA